MQRKADNKPTRCFKHDYYWARHYFRKAVPHGREHLVSLEIAAKSPRGEDLTIDIAWFGSKRPRRIFVHSSGLHGVEGFTGSAIQLQWLHQGIPLVPEDSAIAIVHILNPYGMAWLRRFNENNVDLNRNFLGPGEKFTGAPEGYRRLEKFLNPRTPPSNDLFYLRAAWLVSRFGIAPLRQAVAGGQYEYPKGLFFSGARLEEGPAMFQQFMIDRLAGVERIVAIDIHTGLGRFGDDRLLVDAAPERAAVNQEMQSAFGERVQLLDTRGVACEVHGAHYNLYYRLFPNAKIYFAAQEFGTYHPLRVVSALRAENRSHHYGAGTVNHSLSLRRIFNPDDADWRRNILQRGREVIKKGLGLAFEQ